MLSPDDIQQFRGVVVEEIKASEERVITQLRGEIKQSEERVTTNMRSEIKQSEERVTTNMRSEIKQSEEHIIAKFNEEITDLADVNHLALTTLDAHKQRFERIEQKLELKPAA